MNVTLPKQYLPNRPPADPRYPAANRALGYRDASTLEKAANEAAAQVGVRLSGLRQNAKGDGIASTLKTKTTDKPRTARYRRLNSRTGRTAPGRVCWHGTRDFLRAFFARVPDARVRTAMATYKGAADFERTYRDTRDKRSKYMGYLMAAPVDQLCTCE